MFLEVPIFCNTSETSPSIHELGLDSPDDAYDIRIGKINTDLLIGFYPSEDRKNTICHYNSESFEIRMKYFEFNELLKTIK